MDFDQIIPLGTKADENKIYYFNKADFIHDTAFCYLKVDHAKIQTTSLKSIELPEIDISQTKKLMIYHPTRCRSTVLLQDLFHTGLFATINEPLIRDAIGPNKLIQDLQIRNIQHLGIPCIKSSTAQSMYIDTMIQAYPDCYSVIVIRDPVETLISNLKHMSFGVRELVKGKDFKEISFYAIFLEKFYKTVYENREKLSFVTYKELAQPLFYKKIVNDFGHEVTDEMHQNVLAARKHDSHRNNKVHDQKDRDYSEDFKQYELQVMYIKAKTKTMDYYQKILEYIQ
jgi:hypothetical protein